MAKDREVNIIVDAKNKSKGAFLEVKKDLRGLGDESSKGLGRFSKSFQNADKVIFSFADRMKWMDKIAKRTFQGTAAAAGVYIGATLRDFSQLNDGISKVNTLYDQTGESQRKMYQDSMKMFKMLPTDFGKITQGINDTISAGADPKDATMMARKFGMAGVAGDADMDVVTKAAMGTMNAYKLEAQDLNRILDLQFMTVKKGITSYSELASSLGTGVLASAEAAGITLEELQGSIAMITKNAIPASVATTSLNQMFNKFTDTKVIKEFKKFGVEIQDAKKNTRPLVEIFKDLNHQFDRRKMTSEQRKGFLKELVGSEQAARAIMPLLGDVKEFMNIMDSMDNSSGSMREAYDDRLESMKTQIQMFWNNLKGSGIEQIYTLDPLMKAVMEPTLKRQKLELDIVELEEDMMKFEDNPMMKEMYVEEIARVKVELEKIEMTPVETLRDALAESVKELGRLNPPLAKFLDTIGGFVLSFVGEEGAENREKAGNVVETGVRVYVAKKVIDVVSWFNKNFKLPSFENGMDGNFVRGVKESLPDINKYSSMFNGYATNLTTGFYVPKGYYTGGDRYNELKDNILGIKENKKESKENNKQIKPISNMNLYSLTGPLPRSKESVPVRSIEQIKESINLMNNNIIGELLKMHQLESKIDNNINMASQISVEAPKVDTRVYIDGKNIPVQRVEVDYRKVDKHSEVQARRYGKPQAMLY